MGELHHYFVLLYKYRWETVLLVHLNKISSRRNSTQSTLPHQTAKSDCCNEICLNCCSFLLFWKYAKNSWAEKIKGEEKIVRFPVFELKLSQSRDHWDYTCGCLNFSNKSSLDVPVKTRTCRNCHVNISSHLGKNCVCWTSLRCKHHLGICTW